MATIDIMSLGASAFWSDVGKIALTYILTLPIGWEREQEAHSVGVRTFPIVAMASCGYLLLIHHQAQHDLAAESRLLQGLITGIGFVGGGAILKEGATVRGTATAASIWNTGVLGAAVAIGRSSQKIESEIRTRLQVLCVDGILTIFLQILHVRAVTRTARLALQNRHKTPSPAMSEPSSKETAL